MLRSIGTELIVAAIIAVMVSVLSILWRRFKGPIRRKLALWFATKEIRASIGEDPQSLAFKEELKRLVQSPNGSHFQKATGIVGWHESYQDCRERVENLLTGAKKVNLLLYMSEMHKGHPFYDGLARNNNPTEDFDVRILVCAEDSYYISSDFATSIGKDPSQADEWKRRVNETYERLDRLRRHHGKPIKARCHTIPFIWCLWFIDNTLFLTAFLYYSGQSNIKIPVYELTRGINKGLFEMFEQFFEREWERATPIENNVKSNNL